MTSLTSNPSISKSWTIMVHIPTMSTRAPFVPVMLMPTTGVSVSPWNSAHYRVTKVMEALVSTIMAPLVTVAPCFIWETATPK